tara:strand:+ start:73 stop:1431 length:1359 start_codon:yes stop_codon:yes gene_type:complete
MTIRLGDHLDAGEIHTESLGSTQDPVRHLHVHPDAIKIETELDNAPITMTIPEWLAAGNDALATKESVDTLTTTVNTLSANLASLPPIVDWTQDQTDTTIDSNNIGILPYAPNTLASNGNPGLSNYNLNQTRKNKIDTIGALDFDAPATNFVQNPIGEVPNGRTVAQLETDYPTVHKLLEAMLKIEPAPQQVVSITGASLSFDTSNISPPPGDIEYGLAIPSSLTLSFNRGTWVNAVNPTVLPHPGDGSLLISGMGLTNATATMQPVTITSASPQLITYEYTGITGNFLYSQFVSNGTFTAQLTTGVISTGFVLDNYNNEINGPVSQAFSASSTYTVYLPIFVNSQKVTSTASGTASGGGVSGQNATTKIFTNTNSVIVVDHVDTHTIEVPFDPVTLQIYVEFNSAWGTQTENTVWTKSTPYQKSINGAGVYFWEVNWIGSARDPVDVKITF